MGAIKKIAQKPTAFNAASNATTGKTHNLFRNVVLRTSWPPRVLSSMVILGGGAGLIRRKMRLTRRENAVYDSMYQLCTEACRTDRCTVCRENYKGKWGRGVRD